MIIRVFMLKTAIEIYLLFEDHIEVSLVWDPYLEFPIVLIVSKY